MKFRRSSSTAAQAIIPPLRRICRGRRTRPREKASGIALVLVLVLIALGTVLVVAFFASVSSVSVSERAASSENSATQLAGSAVQLVEGTISYATEPAGDTTYAWACQPGMIRTYGSAGGGPGAANPGQAASSPLAYYKLYSSDNMVVSTATTPSIANFSLASDVPANWDTTPSLYADLNAPLLKQVTGVGGAAPTTTVVFPILDPRAQDLGVEGFGYANASLDGAIQPTGTYTSDSNIRLPMPVKWMYVLKDGTMTVPVTANLATVSWTGAPAAVTPTAANPIVGRVAFWTDDESAKVNVNTASEGTYGDTPICNSGSTSDQFSYPQTTALGDIVLANTPGVQHEYQRYPGHPATTSLSAVFGGALSGMSRATLVKNITDAIPRITDDVAASSMGGTRPFPTPPSTPPPALTTDLDRLYANLDEFQFSPPGTTASSTRAVQTLGTSSSSQTAEQNLVDTCRFFLTAHSKAPELNMFGLPRVAMWPLWDTAVKGTLTPFDREILRCSTVGASATPADPHSFAFFRANALSATADFPSGATAPASGTGVARNPTVYSYLHNLMSRPVPGFGYSFAQKYSTTPSGATDADQILTEIFDYIRCTNLADNSGTASPSVSPPPVPYTGTLGTGGSSNVGSVGEVIPIQISTGTGAGTQGFGRIATLAELVFAFTKVDDRKTTNAAAGGANYVPMTVSGAGSVTAVDPTKQTLVEWSLIPRLVSPMCGYVALANNIRLRFTNFKLAIDGTLVTAPSPMPDIYDMGRITCEQRDSAMGGQIGAESMIEAAYHGLMGSPVDSMYPTGVALVSGVSMYLPPSGALTSKNTMSINGSVTVQVDGPAGTTASPGPTLQTFNLTLPTTTVPIPQVAVDTNTNPPTYAWYGTFRAPSSAYKVNAGQTSAAFTYPSSPTNKTSGRINGPSFSTYVNSNNDVIRSLTPTGTMPGTTSIAGDTRVVATSSTIPSTLFLTTLAIPTGTAGVPPPSTTASADSLRMGVIITTPGEVHGQLSPLAALATSKYRLKPEVPPLATTSIPAPYDWDNGPGLMADGPWTNKPDEGMTSDTTTSLVSTGSELPYIGYYETTVQSGAPQATLFSPNRQVSSPVMFGSLLTGIDHPWRTLLFRPANLPGYQGGYTHPGNASPATAIPDHLLLDLFWMPIVEPYGISEPLATSGKINLNTQIAPFTYITRTTGMNAVLKSVMITALSTANVLNYKLAVSASNNSAAVSRYPIDTVKTLQQMSPTSSDQTSTFPEFSRPTHSAVAPNFFVSPTQICDVPLIPVGYSANFWTTNSLTGDNSLERPYSAIYPRVTTKSNIFTVHVLAQSLRKITTDSNQASWNETKDRVLSESRASYAVEKYFDPNAADLTDSGGNVQTAANDGTISTTAGLRNTKWRLLGVKKFGQ